MRNSSLLRDVLEEDRIQREEACVNRFLALLPQSSNVNPSRHHQNSQLSHQGGSLYQSSESSSNISLLHNFLDQFDDRLKTIAVSRFLQLLPKESMKSKETAIPNTLSNSGSQDVTHLDEEAQIRIAIERSLQDQQASQEDERNLQHTISSQEYENEQRHREQELSHSAQSRPSISTFLSQQMQQMELSPKHENVVFDSKQNEANLPNAVKRPSIHDHDESLYNSDISTNLENTFHEQQQQSPFQQQEKRPTENKNIFHENIKNVSILTTNTTTSTEVLREGFSIGEKQEYWSFLLKSFHDEKWCEQMKQFLREQKRASDPETIAKLHYWLRMTNEWTVDQTKPFFKVRIDSQVPLDEEQDVIMKDVASP